MLRPSKHNHPDQTVINLSIVILRRLIDQRVEQYQSLRALAAAKVPGGETLFLPTMNLLFLLGVVEYRQKTDSFEYVGPNEAVQAV
jgi:hypothetical protein